MKQLSIFDTSAEPKSAEKSSPVSEPEAHTKTRWVLYVDGASRNNPGLAGAGVYILKNGELFLKKGFFLGVRTNNQAEYSALLLGLFFLEKHLQAEDELEIFSDSQLLVRQLKHEYKVKHRDLIPLHACARAFLKDKRYAVKHVMREQNAIADSLANAGIDGRQKNVPADFEHFCVRYQ